MKVILSESQFSRTQKIIIDSIKTIGLPGTIKKYNLNLTAISWILKDTDFNQLDLDVEDISGTIVLLIKNKLINTEYNFDNVKITFDIERGNFVTVEIIIYESDENSISCYGYATPFYEGDQWLPIEISDCFVHRGPDTKNYYIDFKEYPNTPVNFKTFNDFKDWIEIEFPNLIYNTIPGVLKELERVKKEGS